MVILKDEKKIEIEKKTELLREKFKPWSSHWSVLLASWNISQTIWMQIVSVQEIWNALTQVWKWFRFILGNSTVIRSLYMYF